MLGGSGGSGCCNNGGAKKRVVRKPAGKAVGKPKPKAKRGGNAGDANPPTEPVEPVEAVKLVPVKSPDAEPVVKTAEPVESQGGGARKKKGSKVAAKRALSPYNKFVKTQFAILKKKFPDEKAPQIMQKVAIEWNKTKK
jgi:hypothetical protein